MMTVKDAFCEMAHNARFPKFQTDRYRDVLECEFYTFLHEQGEDGTIYFREYAIARDMLHAWPCPSDKTAIQHWHWCLEKMEKGF